MRALPRRLGQTPAPMAALLFVLLVVCALAAGGQQGIGESLGAAGGPAAALALIAMAGVALLPFPDHDGAPCRQLSIAAVPIRQGLNVDASARSVVSCAMGCRCSDCAR